MKVVVILWQKRNRANQQERHPSAEEFRFQVQLIDEWKTLQKDADSNQLRSTTLKTSARGVKINIEEP